MPLIRKLIIIGTSKAVTIPHTWLEYAEKELGQKIKSVTMEVNGTLTIAPYIPKETSPS